jgi:5-methyltetrahydrofolate--homocysteine methyltransferase
VLDASRAVGVATALTSDTGRAPLVEDTAATYASIRAERTLGKTALVSLAEARANAQRLEFAPVAPARPGLTHIAHWPARDLVRYIDWTPFFRAWELAGTFPAILDDPVVGESARALFADAQAMLVRIVEEEWLRPRAVCGFWPARRDGDDILVTADGQERRIPFLRQQVAKREGRPNQCLADFVAEDRDWIGGFAVTAGDAPERLAAFRAANDDYSDILLKALADRFAEALAEALHERVRRELWGHAPGEALTPEQLIREEYRGIRPAPGYPACPDHSLKPILFDLLGARSALGMDLTTSFAMTPAASVSGFYFAHPEAAYFGVARIGRDQLADYARRRGVAIEQAEAWLRPNLEG